MASFTEEHSFKVLLCGDANVGKTTFAQHFDQGLTYDHAVLPPQTTVGFESFYTHYDLPMCQAHVHVELEDMPGGMQHAALLPMYSRESDIFLFLYDLTSRPTFENLRGRWRQFRDDYCTKLEHPITILIGNKKDLVEGLPENERVISREETKQLARDIKAKRCYELSAKSKGKDGLNALRHTLDVALALAVEQRRERAREEENAAPVNELDIFSSYFQEGEKREEEGQKKACCES